MLTIGASLVLPLTTDRRELFFLVPLSTEGFHYRVQRTP